MFCPSCGHANDEGATRCASCGASLMAVPGAGPIPSIPNYLVQSILVTIFCCLPFGIAAMLGGALTGGGT